MAAEEGIITWNVTNWVTVALMASILFFGLGFAQKWYQKSQGKS